jgi:hypothetical protein
MFDAVTEHSPCPHDHVLLSLTARNMFSFLATIAFQAVISMSDCSILQLQQSSPQSIGTLSRCSPIQELAEDPWWLSINSWNRSFNGYQSDVVSPKAFNTADGYANPQKDLAAFISDVLNKKNECSHFTKRRFLKYKLNVFSDKDRSIIERRLRDLPFCAAFEKWAELDAIDHLEIVIASASTSSPASLFGHIFLRAVYDPKKYRKAPGFMPFFQFAVADEQYYSEGPFRRLWDGIVGSFDATLYQRPAYLIERDQAVKLGRTLRRFQIHLSKEKIRDVMERVFEGLNSEKFYRYYFFNRNCAALFAEFLKPALLPEISFHSSQQLVVPPAREMMNWWSQDLVEPVAPDVSSRTEEVRAHIAERKKFVPAELGDEFESIDLETRLSFYQHLTIADKNTFRFMLHTIAMEEYDSDLRHRFEQEPDPPYDEILNIYANLERKGTQAAKQAWTEFDQWRAETLSNRREAEESRNFSAGYWNLSTGYKFFHADTAHHLISFNTGLIREDLGNRSWFGTNSAGDFHLLTGEFDFAPHGRVIFPVIHFNFFDYTSLRRPLPILQPGGRRHWGWEFAAQLERNSFLSRRFDLNFEMTTLRDLWSQHEYADHFLVGVGIQLPINCSSDDDGSRARFGISFDVKARKQLWLNPELAFHAKSRIIPTIEMARFFSRLIAGGQLDFKPINEKLFDGFLEAGADYEMQFGYLHRKVLSAFVNLRIAPK